MAEAMVPRTELAEALEVTERTLQNWENDLGLGQVRGPGKAPEYRLGPLLRWLYEQGERDGSPLSRARLRETEAKASIKEMELAQARRDVVYMADHARTVGAIADAVRGWIQGLPGRWTPKLPGDKRKVSKALRALAAEAAADIEASVARAIGHERSEDDAAA